MGGRVWLLRQTALLLGPVLLILRSCGHAAVEDQHCLRERQISEACRHDGSGSGLHRFFSL